MCESCSEVNRTKPGLTCCSSVKGFLITEGDTLGGGGGGDNLHYTHKTLSLEGVENYSLKGQTSHSHHKFDSLMSHK